MKHRCYNCPRKEKECLGEVPFNGFIKEQIEEQIISVVKILYENDEHLIIKNVNEVCISAHFWYYFKQKYDRQYEGLNIDIEYNRNGSKAKDGPTNTKAKPDMIIHRRECNRYNYVCFEFKKNTRYIQHDYDKLEFFTGQSNIYKYHYGVSILLKKKEVIIVWFENGMLTDSVIYDTNTWKKMEY